MVKSLTTEERRGDIVKLLGPSRWRRKVAIHRLRSMSVHQVAVGSPAGTKNGAGCIAVVGISVLRRGVLRRIAASVSRKAGASAGMRALACGLLSASAVLTAWCEAFEPSQSTA